MTSPQSPTILREEVELFRWLESGSSQRLLLVTGPSGRFRDQFDLSSFEVATFEGAARHVPRDVVERAQRVLEAHRADTVITLGGGSATGIGKILRRQNDVRFAAVPTTYAASEMTNIYGMTDGTAKETGRDDAVRPDVVLRLPDLFESMPQRLAVQSLFNALAHPLSAAAAAGELEAEGARAVTLLTRAIECLLDSPSSRFGREDALAGSALAGRILDMGKLGEHHQVVHRLGGMFDVDHAGLHAVLLPHFVQVVSLEQPDLFRAFAAAAGVADLPAWLFDGLVRVGAPRDLGALNVDFDSLETLIGQVPAWVEFAGYGRRPSVRVRRVERQGRPSTSVYPSSVEQSVVVLALHGRGSNADQIVSQMIDVFGHREDVQLVAPQATRNVWYPASYRASLHEHGDALRTALSNVEAELDDLTRRVAPERIYLAGFSQGACLAIEAFARTAHNLGGLIAFAGARIGGRDEQPKIHRELRGARVALGIAGDDRWVDAPDVAEVAAELQAAGADVRLVGSAGDVHELTARQRRVARATVFGEPSGQRGFGNAHESEALQGALPKHQNSPREVPFRLYPEQINGTGFAAERSHNLRTWLYKVRPSAIHSDFAPLEHPTFVDDWRDEGPEVNLLGYEPPPAPETPTDFIDGVLTFGGAGHPQQRRGYAIHLYSANRSMEHRAFYDADGDLLIVPQLGGLVLKTELGFLDVPPGCVAVVPRGIKFSVLLTTPHARGYVAEVYGRHFELPPRGPVGSNGLTDPRHFQAPAASFETRLDVEYRITAKLGNRLYEARQDFSPFDVVAWHGDYTPYVYDLGDFCPVGNTRFDHPDPSIYSVLSAPLDETGTNTLDLVFFPPRWDPTEHTFRPPFFHRNATTEFNGIIEDPGLNPKGPFREGGYFLTPSMTAHGVMARAVERALSRAGEDADRPVRIGDKSKWFQFEMALPISLTHWARETTDRIEGWKSQWGAYRTHFDPTRR